LTGFGTFTHRPRRNKTITIPLVATKLARRTSSSRDAEKPNWWGRDRIAVTTRWDILDDTASHEPNAAPSITDLQNAAVEFGTSYAHYLSFVTNSLPHLLGRIPR